jgi:hypothetical protein
MRMPIHYAWLVLVILIGGLAANACRPLFTEAPSPFSTPTIPLPTPISALSATPPPAPLETAIPTETATPVPTVTTTATIRRSTTPTLGISPGVYVTAIKIEPLSAKSNEMPQFTVTFLNTTGQTTRYRWFIKIFSPDQTPSFGETPKVESDISPGASQLKALSEWRTQTFFGCLFFTARVFWVDADNRVDELLKPDQSSPGTGFSVCP